MKSKERDKPSTIKKLDDCRKKVSKSLGRNKERTKAANKSMAVERELQQTKGEKIMEEDKLTRKKAIRLKCLDCMAGQVKEVRLCPSRDCPLWIFRMGREIKELDKES